MRQRAIKFTDKQWAVVQQMADDAGLPASELVRLAVEEYAARQGKPWPESPAWGGVRAPEKRG